MTTSAAYEQIKAALDAIQARIESGELQEAESNALGERAERLIEELAWFAAPHTLAPTMHEAYGPGQLVADIDRPLLNLARLSDAHDKHDHGWGEELDKRLGGLSPGYILAVGASGAGFGKTAFVMQLADGLALQSVTDNSGPVTPVLILSEMPAYALTWRTLARWIGVDQRLLRGRPSGRGDDDAMARKDAKERVAAALAGGPFLEARKMIRVLGERAGSGPTAIERAEKVMAGWVADLRNEYPNRKIWPVLVIDPIQRFQDHGKGEVESLNELVEALGAVITRNQWCAFLTSDTNKPSASGDMSGKSAQQEGAAAFRGSYKLQHLADVVLYLRRSDKNQSDIEAVLVKNRWGKTGKDGDWPTFTFDGPKMQFKPIGTPQPSKR